MKRIAQILSLTFALASTAAPIGCSSSSGGGGSGGSTGGAAGTPGTGGASTGGSSGPAGSTGAAGAAGGGGAAGGPGGGSGVSGGTGGLGGHGGAAGAPGGESGAAGGKAGALGGNSGGGGGASAALVLTSTAFTEGTMIPPAQTCTGGSQVSPPLAWTAGPAATKSYGVALLDKTNGFVHWTLWDLPPGTTSLPGGLPGTQTLTTPVTGQQVNRFGGHGYSGPCPNGQTHTYVFEVYALDVATLPSVSATSTPEEVRAQMTTHALAEGTLSGTSNARM
ncbi:MAG: YbhB/YbcL family Raf kinase inhibitor-like protein [Pseudomonadota bacterium]